MGQDQVVSYMREDEICINTQPAVLASEVANIFRAVTPSEQDIAEVQRQLLCRHADLPLREKIAPEEVIEGFFRCFLTDHLQRRFKVELVDIPSCINSSHTAVRGICIEKSQHSHQSITDAEWKKAWPRFKDQHPEVNIYVPGRRSALRADLYLVAQGGIVSVEFKYLGSRGALNVNGCVAQMRRYVENHAATLLVIYANSSDGKEVRGLDRLRNRLDPSVHVIFVSGPAITDILSFPSK